MTQEDEELLFKDLGSRLSYGVICQVDDGAAGLNDGKLVEIDISKELVRFDADYYWDAYIDDIKPYLRPLSSMAEEEFDDMFKQLYSAQEEFFRNCSNTDIIGKIIANDSVKYDWLNAHHFDYRNLIEKGLAIEVTEENNPYKMYVSTH